jgi:hypothetical protein
MLPVAPVHKLIVPSVMLRWANGAQ